MLPVHDDKLPPLPDTFRQTILYLDETPKYDSPLARNVFSTDHSQQIGVAGMPIHQVPLWKMLYGGMNNWCLRPISVGKTCYVILTRSFQSSVFLYNVSKDLRACDIQLVANLWNSTKSSPAPSTSDEEKKKVVEDYATFCCKQIMDPKSGDAALLQRITQLETELAKFRTSETTSKFIPGDKHLLIDCPKSKTARDVTAWINRVVPKPAQKRLSKITVELQIEHKDMDEDTALEHVRARLVTWGMPIQKAAEFEYELGCKVISGCTLI
jgi:hypothetical protein